jgi:hypothetical protein
MHDGIGARRFDHTAHVIKVGEITGEIDPPLSFMHVPRDNYLIAARSQQRAQMFTDEAVASSNERTQKLR